MQETNFDDAFELIRARDQRYPREAYFFVREALDYTQKHVMRNSHARVRHVTGQELLEGIREFALAQFGPMSVTVFEEWQIRSCQDFGEIVFNMVETPVAAGFSETDFRDTFALLSRLHRPCDALGPYLWRQFSETARHHALAERNPDALAGLLADGLNRIIVQEPIYDPRRFVSVRLSVLAKSLLGHRFAGVQLARVNRLLLEEAYPLEIAKGPGLLAKTEKDSRADFEGGYDFWDAFRKPFLPSHAQGARRREANPTRA
jgi:uncharacterized repeat protein (TIGR04138 family)